MAARPVVSAPIVAVILAPFLFTVLAPLFGLLARQLFLFPLRLPCLAPIIAVAVIINAAG